MKKELDWNDISFVSGSPNRKKVLKNLTNPRTPTQLKKISEMHFNSVSRALKELEKRGLVKCLTANSSRSKYYNITEKGLKIKEELEKLE